MRLLSYNGHRLDSAEAGRGRVAGGLVGGGELISNR